MKIRIEPLNRTSIRMADWYEDTGDIKPILMSGRQLHVNIKPQHRRNWCWASVASAIAIYYGNRFWEQERVAWRVLDENFDAGEMVPNKMHTDQRFDLQAQLDKALRLVGCLAGWSGARPPFRRLMRELDSGRPLAVAVAWGTGGQHYVLVDGYERHRRMISISDPEAGKMEFCFDRFPEEYRDGGEWAETYWTTWPQTNRPTIGEK